MLNYTIDKFFMVGGYLNSEGLIIRYLNFITDEGMGYMSLY